MNRRNFLTGIAALPVIGLLYPQTAAAKITTTSVGIPKLVDPLEKYNFRRIVVMIKQELRTIVKTYQFELCDEITRNRFNIVCAEMLNRFRFRGVIENWILETEIRPITHSLDGKVFVSPRGANLEKGPYVVIDFKLATHGVYGIIE